MRKLLALLLALSLWLPFACAPAYGAAPPTPGYQSIAGVTQAEIAAIEALKSGGRTFSYGTLLSTESFLDENGMLDGYTRNLCELLTQMFGIPFLPELLDLDELFQGLASSRIDFSGELFLTPERSREYFMSDAIAVRSVSLFFLRSQDSIQDIAKYPMPVLGFLRDAVHYSQLSALGEAPFEAVFLESLSAVPAALHEGRIDAFVGDNVAEAAFQDDLAIACKPYSPLLCGSVALTTQNPELAVIISVFNKYIAGGGQAELSALYAQGVSAYNHSLLRKNFTPEEKAYIDSHVEAGQKVPIILESGNYPISFYNEQSREFQGIVPDLLSHLTLLTDLEFEVINDPEESWASVLEKLQTGQASLISELLHTESRKGLFLWPKEPSCVTHYALLSKSDAPKLDIYQMLGKRIGVETDTAYYDVALQWFPNVELLAYPSIDDTFDALDRGEIDLIMASENLLLSQTNYSEKPGYKVNFAIDYTAESKLGFHIGEAVLLSIFEKTYPFIDSDNIVRNWMNRVFDYSAQLSRTRVEMLLISTVLLTAFIALLAVFLMKNGRHRRELSSTVKARTAQLEEKTAALATIYNAIPDLLFSKDLQGRYTSCNPSFEAYAGISESEILGKYASEIFSRVDLETLESEMAQEQDLITSDTSGIVEQLVTYPDGEQRLLETIKTSLRQNGAVVGMMGISRDITAHKAAQKAALAASKAKSSFLARMSHEIRTPLNAIIGMAEITKSSVDNPQKTISSVNQIIVSSHHLLRLINDVLDMSKIESGNLEIFTQPFRLLDAFEETLTITSARCNERSLVLEHNISQLPDIGIMGDKLRLNQVLINLLSNAIKFTEPGGRVVFMADVTQDTEAEIRLRFSVKDSGIGMSPEQIARLFNPFEQADSSIAARFGGTGLGLSISQNLVQQMDGLISVKSAVGDGSEFYFELSFPKSVLPDSSPKAPNRTPNLSGARILLADDIEINRMIVTELLAPTHAAIDMAFNGREAVEKFEKAAPGYYQLIFMDILMPEMNGYEATEAIRALSHPDAGSIPIIAMTANAYTEDVKQSFAAGMNGHIGKPINIDELMNTLSSYLGDEKNGEKPIGKTEE